MISYSQREVFTDFAHELYVEAGTWAAALPTWWRTDGSWCWSDTPPRKPVPEVRCHEVVRAIDRVMGITAFQFGAVVDGYYGLVEHSWLALFGLENVGGPSILDVYAVGRLPMVQLVCVTTATTPEYENYETGDPRTDINQPLVDQMVHELERWRPKLGITRRDRR